MDYLGDRNTGEPSIAASIELLGGFYRVETEKLQGTSRRKMLSSNY